MKRTLFIALIAALTAPVGLIAQEVYMESGKIIFDMTAAAGMPADAVTNTPKYDATYMGSNTPKVGSIMANNLHSGWINATVYEKLEIAPQDINTSAVIGGTGTFTMNWVTAFTNCQSSTYNGGGWRLPTQRELQMIWIFKVAINDLSTTPLTTNGYWSATEYANNEACYVLASNGTTGNNSKGYSNYSTRCVREVGATPPTPPIPPGTMNGGFFAGDLLEGPDGDWQFEYRMYVSDTDASTLGVGVQWAKSTTATGVQDALLGKQNTLTLNQSSFDNYPAANLCFKKNNNYSSITNIDDSDYIWYLPAQMQLMAVWVVYNSIDNAHKLGKALYWSSTEYFWTTTNAWYVNVDDGGDNGAAHNKTNSSITGPVRVRCIREGF